MRIDYTDLMLLAKYLEKYCNNSPIQMEITHEGRLKIDTRTTINEDVEITIYPCDDKSHLLFPTITKKEKLTV